MPLALNEIRARAVAFAQEFRDATSERADSQIFWRDFFQVFGINARRVGSFEKPVRNPFTAAGRGRIDYLWKGTVLVEHKSRDEDLGRAAGQARDYFLGLKDSELPRFVIVSDFARLRLYDLETGGKPTEFSLAELPERLDLFGFISGYTTRRYGALEPVDTKASETLGQLHDLLERDGFTGRSLDLWMVRTLFCLFADRSGIFQTGIFRDLIENRAAEDGADLGAWITRLHRVLASPENQRQRSLDESLVPFPYVDGRLFDDPVEQPDTNAQMRNALLECCNVDWSRVSPAIFGSLFQSIKDKTERRLGGEHYTTEENILKCLGPLLLDGLRVELAAMGREERRLNAFLLKLRRTRVFDPACGCGNFLVVAYRELRRLELQALRLRYGGDDAGQLVGVVLSQVNVDQMFGIEVDDWPAEIAQVALWLTDHQMNMELSAEFGTLRMRLPLTIAPHILHGNALREDWAAFVPPKPDVYCVGNPPFIGHQYRSAAQQADMHAVWGRQGKVNRLDYVTCWFRMGAEWMAKDRRAECCFVATNSISQGEQVGTLWGDLLHRGVTIRFAHRTFQWSSEAKGKAAVHCVIVGFGLREPAKRLLFDYATPRGVPQQVPAANINPYLVDAPNVLLPSRTRTPPGLPRVLEGSKPVDGGFLIFDDTERSEFLRAEPKAAPYVKVYLGGKELINGTKRWCLWLKNIEPSKLRQLSVVRKRLAAVRAVRLASPTEEFQKFAAYPALFVQDRQPATRYLAIPKVSSEGRKYIPMAFLEPEVIASDLLIHAEGAALWQFGILCSTMHMAWVRAVCGRLKSDFRYAPAVYNNFPWPELADADRAAIGSAANGVLEARAAHPLSTLADLYDPLSMPPDLTSAHVALDRAVDAAFGQRGGFTSEAKRLAFLFSRYQASVAPLDAAPPRVRRARRAKTM
jgi:hypothetical protein